MLSCFMSNALCTSWITQDSMKGTKRGLERKKRGQRRRGVDEVRREGAWKNIGEDVIVEYKERRKKNVNYFEISKKENGKRIIPS